VADIHRIRTIAASPRETWDVLADFGSIAAWADIADHSCLLTPAADGVAVGTVRRVQVRRDTLVERITEFDPPRTLGYDVEGFPRWLRRVTNRWTLRPERDGSTLVTLTSTVEIGPGLSQRLAERIVARFSAKQIDAMLAGLATRLEKSHV
jgi:uncharacterized protein YndB with AHSA1/START domain